MVYEAIKAGYRLLDGAGDYGNEKEAGEGVRRALQDGLVKREELCESTIIDETLKEPDSYTGSHHFKGKLASNVRRLVVDQQSSALEHVPCPRSCMLAL
jgi:diketogulonate reductase-like aldo/keto reductase